MQDPGLFQLRYHKYIDVLTNYCSPHNFGTKTEIEYLLVQLLLNSEQCLVK